MEELADIFKTIMMLNMLNMYTLFSKFSPQIGPIIIEPIFLFSVEV